MIENIGAYSQVDYDRGYADAIDKCINVIDKVFVYTDSRGMDRYASYCQMSRNSVKTMLEQLKEQTNE